MNNPTQQKAVEEAEARRKKGIGKFPIENDVPYRQEKLLSLSDLADLMGEFTNDNTEHPIWDFYFWLDNKCKPQEEL